MNYGFQFWRKQAHLINTWRCEDLQDHSGAEANIYITTTYFKTPDADLSRQELEDYFSHPLTFRFAERHFMLHRVRL